MKTLVHLHRKTLFIFRRMNWSSDPDVGGAVISGSWPNNEDNVHVMKAYEALPHIEEVLGSELALERRSMTWVLLVKHRLKQATEGQQMAVPRTLYVSTPEGKSEQITLTDH